MPFEKGKSGNPLGRKREKKVRTALEMVLAEGGEDLKSLRAIWKGIIRKAVEDEDLACAKEVFDRHDGKVPQAIVGDDDEDSINVLTRIERVIVKAKD